jgi:hypothetical protein
MPILARAPFRWWQSLSLFSSFKFARVAGILILHLYHCRRIRPSRSCFFITPLRRDQHLVYTVPKQRYGCPVMKSLGLRRSVKDTGSSPYNPQTLPTLSKPVSAVVPPKKVIRALSNYRPTAPQELSFAKGDFFYVIRDVVHANGGEYYEAHNPVTGSRGLVPSHLFEGFDKSNPK